MRTSSFRSPALRGIGEVSPAVSVLSPVFALIAKEKKKALGELGQGQDEMQKQQHPPLPKGVEYAFMGVSMLSMAASTYHGYKRNKSVGWAIWWGVMGAMFPIITPVIAFAQGYGKPIEKTSPAKA